MNTFTHEKTITIRDADVAGVLFFARYFSLAHEAFEAFMKSKGLGFAALLRENGVALSVVHAECDYRSPLHLEETVVIAIAVTEIRRRSFTVEYDFRNAEGKRAATVHTLHVAVSKATRRAVPLPRTVLHALRSGE